jgi:hypothetical protein
MQCPNGHTQRPILSTDTITGHESIEEVYICYFPLLSAVNYLCNQFYFMVAAQVLPVVHSFDRGYRLLCLYTNTNTLISIMGCVKDV